MAAAQPQPSSDALRTVRRKIKAWERTFHQTQWRPPTKDDIRKDGKVAELYTQYKRLKIAHEAELREREKRQREELARKRERMLRRKQLQQQGQLTQQPTRSRLKRRSSSSFGYSMRNTLARKTPVTPGAPPTKPAPAPASSSPSSSAVIPLSSASTQSTSMRRSRPSKRSVLTLKTPSAPAPAALEGADEPQSAPTLETEAQGDAPSPPPPEPVVVVEPKKSKSKKRKATADAVPDNMVSTNFVRINMKRGYRGNRRRGKARGDGTMSAYRATVASRRRNRLTRSQYRELLQEERNKSLYLEYLDKAELAKVQRAETEDQNGRVDDIFEDFEGMQALNRLQKTAAAASDVEDEQDILSDDDELSELRRHEEEVELAAVSLRQANSSSGGFLDISTRPAWVLDEEEEEQVSQPAKKRSKRRPAPKKPKKAQKKPASSDDGSDDSDEAFALSMSESSDSSDPDGDEDMVKRKAKPKAKAKPKSKPKRKPAAKRKRVYAGASKSMVTGTRTTRRRRKKANTALRVPPPDYKPPPALVEQLALGKDADALTVLNEAFGFDRFLPHQLTAIAAVLRGRSTLAVLPTGSGKSLCFQLPSLLLPGLTLVVTPLIALMQDQLAHLPPCLPGALWTSQQSQTEVLQLISLLRTRKLKVLFLSPEKMLSPGFLRLMSTLPAPGVTLVAIDEAHCVSEWSHNFRPAYMRLCPAIRDTLGAPPIVALTATATRRTEASIMKLLGMNDYHHHRHQELLRRSLGSFAHPPVVVRTSPHRKSLHLLVTEAPNRQYTLLNLLTRHEPFKSLDSVIVYVSMRHEADNLADYLRANRIVAQAYHSGKTAHQRATLQKKFMEGKVRVIIATVAFGMGLDKEDVRAVIHFNVPRSLEHYVQEVGRAGRDGKDAFCMVLYDQSDLIRHRTLVQSDSVDSAAVDEFVARVFCEVERDEDRARVRKKKKVARNGWKDRQWKRKKAMDHKARYSSWRTKAWMKKNGIVDKYELAREAEDELQQRKAAGDIVHRAIRPKKSKRVVEEVESESESSDADGDEEMQEGGKKEEELEDDDFITGARVKEGSLVAISLEDAENDLFLKPEMAGTLLSQLQLGLEIASLVDGDAPSKPARAEQYVEVISRLHNVIRVGFHKTPAAELAKKCKLVGWLLSCAKGEPDARTGRYTVELVELANKLRCRVSAIQRDLMKLRSDGELSLDWDDMSIVLLVKKQPRSLRAVSQELMRIVEAKQRLSLLKLDSCAAALKLAAHKSVTKALEELPKMTSGEVEEEEEEEEEEEGDEEEEEEKDKVPRYRAGPNRLKSSVLAEVISDYFDCEGDGSEVLAKIEATLPPSQRIGVKLLNLRTDRRTKHLESDIKMLCMQHRVQLGSSAHAATCILQGVHTASAPAMFWRKNEYWGRYDFVPFQQLLQAVQRGMAKVEEVLKRSGAQGGGGDGSGSESDSESEKSSSSSEEEDDDDEHMMI